MATLMLVNVALFLPVVVGGCFAAWLGWRLTAPDARGNDGWQGPPRWWRPPVRPSGPAGPNDLARSA
jgi:hypothetical protein